MCIFSEREREGKSLYVCVSFQRERERKILDVREERVHVV